MAPLATVGEVAEALGYLGSAGFVDGSAPLDPGPRDVMWSDLRDKCGVDAAYFRGAVPQAAFVRVTSDNAVREVHGRLWNYSRVPVLIAVTPDSVSALSCAAPPAAGPSGVDPSVLAQARADQSVTTVLADFTRFSVESGRALLNHKDKFGPERRVDQVLLANLRALRAKLGARGMGADAVEALLGRAIFVRYLEQRGILTRQAFEGMGLPTSIIECLDAGWAETSRLFEEMANHFNGDVFHRGQFSHPVDTEALVAVATFLHGGDAQSSQRSLWPYDFRVIPTELISSIYEQLLESDQKSNAAYYTPRSLVGLILDEVLPWAGPATDERVLDPACGSGIFLAEAFRRLAYRLTQNLGRPCAYTELKELLTHSIYGVDLSGEAIGVTAFSLYLALLENVDPPTVWREARLPNLIGTNLVESDFFGASVISERQYTTVVGNPPWRSALTPAATDYLRSRKASVPDRQIAWAFAWRAADLVEETGSVGLVLPATSLLHTQSGPARATRSAFFNDLDVEMIADLSDLREYLIPSAKAPAAVAFYRRQIPARGSRPYVLHVGARRAPITTVVDELVIPQRNIIRLPRSLARGDPGVWSQCLCGGLRDIRLVQRLRQSHPSLERVVRDRRWTVGAGFILAPNQPQFDARHLQGLPLVPPRAFRPMIPPLRWDDAPRTLTAHRPREIDIYRAPHVLMKKGFPPDAFPLAAFLPEDAAFTDDFFAVASREGDADNLRVLTGLLNSSVARYWYFMTGRSWGVEREQLMLGDWMTLPVPTIVSRHGATILRAMRDAAAGVPETEWRPPLDFAVEAAYGLTEDERLLVHEGLSVNLEEFQHGAKARAYQRPGDGVLVAYCDALKRDLDLLDVGTWDVRVMERAGGLLLVACRLLGTTAHTQTPILEDLTAGASLNRIGWESPSTIIEPSTIVLNGSAVFIVKPDQLRCWTVTQAYDDAADVFGGLLSAPTIEAGE